MGSHRERVSLALARSFYLPNLIGFCVGTHTASKLAYTPGVDHRMQDPMATELDAQDAPATVRVRKKNTLRASY